MGETKIIKILDSESSTRWLTNDSASASTYELGKITKFLCPHCLRVHKV